MNEELGHYRTDPIGAWEGEVLRMTSNADRWIRGGHVPTALFEARRVAHRTDQVPDELHLEALEKALAKLDRELEVFTAHVRGLSKEVGYLIAAVHQALELGQFPDPGPEYRDDLLDDTIVDRLGDFYGIPRPYSKGDAYRNDPKRRARIRYPEHADDE